MTPADLDAIRDDSTRQLEKAAAFTNPVASNPDSLSISEVEDNIRSLERQGLISAAEAERKIADIDRLGVDEFLRQEEDDR